MIVPLSLGDFLERAEVVDPNGLSGEATHLFARAIDLPTGVDVAISDDGRLSLDTIGGAIGEIELLLTSGPELALAPGIDGLLLIDEPGTAQYANTLVVVGETAPEDRVRLLQGAGATVVRVPLREGRTLHHDGMGHFGAGRVYVRSAPQGTEHGIAAANFRLPGCRPNRRPSCATPSHTAPTHPLRTQRLMQIGKAHPPTATQCEARRSSPLYGIGRLSRLSAGSMTHSVVPKSAYMPRATGISDSVG